jgi:hypothetical protein
VKTVKITKMASNDDPPATVSGSEGLIPINLDKEGITKVFKGTSYRRVAKLS